MRERSLTLDCLVDAYRLVPQTPLNVLLSSEFRMSLLGRADLDACRPPSAFMTCNKGPLSC